MFSSTASIRLAFAQGLSILLVTEFALYRTLDVLPFLFAIQKSQQDCHRVIEHEALLQNIFGTISSAEVASWEAKGSFGNFFVWRGLMDTSLCSPYANWDRVSQPTSVSVSVLGDVGVYEKYQRHSGLLPGVSVISPNGGWLGITFGSRNEGDFFCGVICTETGGLSLPKSGGEDVRNIGIRNDGQLIGRVGGSSLSDGSRRPFTFRFGEKDITLLQPEIPDSLARIWEDRGANHTPTSLFADGSILGWTHLRARRRLSVDGASDSISAAVESSGESFSEWPLFEATVAARPLERESSLGSASPPLCLWQRSASGNTFRLGYLTFPDQSTALALPDGRLLLGKSDISREGPVPLEVWDGQTREKLPVELFGHHLQLLYADSTGGFCGRVSISRKNLPRLAECLGEAPEEMESEHLKQSGSTTVHFYGAPQFNRLLWLANKQVSFWPAALSASGKYLLGKNDAKEPEDRFLVILTREGAGFDAQKLRSDAWQFEEGVVADDGTVYAAAYCNDASSPHFRLTLPVKITTT